jgi:4-hydroxybenzoate polyprenyltransferase
MTRRSRSIRWALVFAALTVGALIVCVVATVTAGALAPVFFWPVPDGSSIVATKQQYESAISARQVARATAVASLVLGLAAAGLIHRGRRTQRSR